MKVLVLGHSSFLQRRALKGLLAAGLSEIDLASRTKQPANGWPHGNLFSDYAEALARTSAELVYISLVNSQHAEWTEQALLSGRHVLVDKPAFLSIDDAQRLVELAISSRLCLAELVTFGEHPLVKSGIETLRQNGGTTRLHATLSVPLWPADDFRRNVALGGGAINDIGPYAAAAARLFFASPPLDIHAHILTRANDVDAAFGLFANFANGGAMTGLFGFDTAYINEITAFGPNARIRMPRAFTLPDGIESRQDVWIGNADHSRTIDAADSIASFIRNLVNAIRGGDTKVFHADLLADATFLSQLRKSCGEQA